MVFWSRRSLNSCNTVERDICHTTNVGCSCLGRHQRKRMECHDGRGQRSIDDVAECGGPKEKLAMSSFVRFLFDKYLNKIEF